MGPIYLLPSIQKMKPMSFVMQISYIYIFFSREFYISFIKSFQICRLRGNLH